MSLLIPSGALEASPHEFASLGVAFDSNEKPLVGTDPFASVMGAQRGSSSMPGARGCLDDDLNPAALTDSKMVMTLDGQAYSYISLAPKQIAALSQWQVVVPTWRYEILPYFNTGKTFVKANFDIELPSVRDNTPTRFACAKFHALAPTPMPVRTYPPSADFVFNKANEDGNWKFVLECDIDGAGSLIFTGVLAAFCGDRSV